MKYHEEKKEGEIWLGNYRMCIPYEGNEHLIVTTDDCDEFYKTW